MSSHLIRSDLIPIVTGYLIVMVILAVGLRNARRRTRAGQPLTRYTGRIDRGWPAFLYHALTDGLGGYLLLAGVVVLYYYFVARVGGSFLDSEFSGSAILVGIAFPIYFAASLLRQHRRGRRGTGQPGHDGQADQNGTDEPPA
jgi:Family of unknown function (DUF6256)